MSILLFCLVSILVGPCVALSGSAVGSFAGGSHSTHTITTTTGNKAWGEESSVAESTQDGVPVFDFSNVQISMQGTGICFVMIDKSRMGLS